LRHGFPGPAPQHHSGDPHPSRDEVEMTTPQSSGPQPGLVSPLVLDNPPPAAATAVLTDEQDRRVVLVELRLNPGAVPAEVQRQFEDLFASTFTGADAPPEPQLVGRHYLRCKLTPTEVQRLVGGSSLPTDRQARRARDLIYHVWPDLVVDAHLDRSLSTIKADAAERTYGCRGDGIVWGVLDSGINETHPHFAQYVTLAADAVKDLHKDFSLRQPGVPDAPLVDVVGHGTHVAGIIAGCAPSDPASLRIAVNEPTAQDFPLWAPRTLAPGTTLSGVAAKANLVSLKVLDDKGKTLSSVIIDALAYVREVNSYGRELQIHGVNLSLGCGWLPRDYAAGQSPLCRELDLLVGTGVIAVVSAGNSGAGGTQTGVSSDVYGQLSTITDPGNAAGAITVGSVHRYRPHTYGITFDSSKGPTLDGRMKPDVVAPGERITSAATGQLADRADVLQLAAGQTDSDVARYIEDSGTSMAAAHVSGVIAALMSARTEYIGQPELVRNLITTTASDLGRHQFFQGAGLVDLLRALSAT
jgi:subtilisin family serine protease